MAKEQKQQLREKFFEDNVGKFSATNNDVVMPAEDVWNWIVVNCLPIQEKSDAIEFAEWIVDKYRKGECVGADGFNRDTIKYTAKELLEAFKSKTK